MSELPKVEPQIRINGSYFYINEEETRYVFVDYREHVPVYVKEKGVPGMCTLDGEKVMYVTATGVKQLPLLKVSISLPGHKAVEFHNPMGLLSKESFMEFLNCSFKEAGEFFVALEPANTRDKSVVLTKSLLATSLIEVVEDTCFEPYAGKFE